MPHEITNINKAQWREDPNGRGGTWRYIDLSGDHLGVRMESLAPGEHSSYHHYHTTEEEHLLITAGAPTLYLGDDKVMLGVGDHICFKAGDATAHHLSNETQESVTYLVFGERHEGDVVFYPDSSVALVKAMSMQTYNYSQRKQNTHPADKK